jgi:hypothetical protein
VLTPPLRSMLIRRPTCGDTLWRVMTPAFSEPQSIVRASAI